MISTKLVQHRFVGSGHHIDFTYKLEDAQYGHKCWKWFQFLKK